jgi:hypothetical protein
MCIAEKRESVYQKIKTGLFDIHLDKLHQEHVGRENGKLSKS